MLKDVERVVNELRRWRDRSIDKSKKSNQLITWIKKYKKMEEKGINKMVWRA